jgi:Pyruvate/2-oxoacid:ferredoxin oxidoreductase gamma subunit
MKNEPRYEIRFSGSGGQGIITAAVVFADAVGTLDGKYVCQTQSYGPEARGGKSKAEVVISSEPIDYPKAMRIDLLLAMTQASCDAYFFDIKPDGLLSSMPPWSTNCRPAGPSPFPLPRLPARISVASWWPIWWRLVRWPT